MRNLEQLNYRTAIYCRLSREDGNEESQSIQAQKSILLEFVEKQGWQLVDIYVDDGYSGTNFDRPDFKRLLHDIEIGKIDLVITKDLSRLGRNYIETGFYTEDFFPTHNIRYIALNDNYDTGKEDGAEFAPFKNIINEWYAKDISKKIRFTLDNKAKNGEARGTARPIFGYNYNASAERIPDPITAPIVQTIFKKYVEFGSSVKVARYMTEHKYKIPAYYHAIHHNFDKKKVMAMSEEQLTTWSYDTIRQIIRNEAYIGTYKTALTKSLNYKLKKRIKNKDCFVFENRYEPLIDRETFEVANKIMARTRSGTIPLDENMFKGLVFCSDCGKLMRYTQVINRKTFDEHIGKYYCGNKYCGSCNMTQKKHILFIVKRELEEIKNIILSNEQEFIEFANSMNKKGRELELDNKKEIRKLNDKNAEIDIFIQNLFEQSVKGIIPTSTFEMMMTKYKKEKEMLDTQIKELTLQTNKELSEERQQASLDRLISLLKEMDLTSDISPHLIQKIIKRIDVRTTKINNSNRFRNYDVTITYSYCNDLIKEFVTNEE